MKTDLHIAAAMRTFEANRERYAVQIGVSRESLEFHAMAPVDAVDQLAFRMQMWLTGRPVATVDDIEESYAIQLYPAVVAALGRFRWLGSGYRSWLSALQRRLTVSIPVKVHRTIHRHLCPHLQNSEKINHIQFLCASEAYDGTAEELRILRELAEEVRSSGQWTPSLVRYEQVRDGVAK